MIIYLFSCLKFYRSEFVMDLYLKKVIVNAICLLYIIFIIDRWPFFVDILNRIRFVNCLFLSDLPFYCDLVKGSKMLYQHEISRI